MANNEPRFARARRILLVVFLVSALLSIVLILTPSFQNPDSTGAGAMSAGLQVVTTASVFTAATTLVGFASITVLMWRRDRRETRAADVELKKARLELEKLERMQEEEDPGSDLDALRRQLDKEQKNLLLIEERRAEHVMDTDVPLKLIRQERHTRERIMELKQRIAKLE
jgi:preprotein translocase subunit SecG